MECSILITLPLIINNFSLPASIVLFVFWIILFLLLLPLPVSRLQRRFTALSNLLPKSSSGMDHCPPKLCTHPPPASLRRSSLCTAPHAYLLRRVPRLFAPPLMPSTCSKVPVNTWGVVRCSSFRFHHVPSYVHHCVNCRLPSSSGVWFHSPQVEFFVCKYE